MPERLSVVLWSAGGGLLLGLFVDAVVVGVWMLIATAFPALAPKNFPRPAGYLAIVALAIIPTASAVLGYLEGRLKAP
jgi:hypothetical protein